MLKVGSMREKMATLAIPKVEERLGKTIVQISERIEDSLDERFGIHQIKEFVEKGYLPEEDLAAAKKAAQVFKEENQGNSFIEFARSLIHPSEAATDVKTDEKDEHVPVVNSEIVVKATGQVGQIKDLIKEGNLDPPILNRVNEALAALGGNIEINEEVAALLRKFDKDMEGVEFTDQELALIAIVKEAMTSSRGAKMVDLAAHWIDDADLEHKRDRAGKALKYLNAKLSKRHWEVFNENKNKGKGAEANYILKDNTPVKLEFIDATHILFNGELVSLTERQMNFMKAMSGMIGEEIKSSQASLDTLGSSDTTTTGFRALVRAMMTKLNIPDKKEFVVYSGRQAKNSWVKLQGVEVIGPK